MSRTRFEQLVGKTYDAALDSALWPDVLRGVREETGAVAGGILQNSRTSQFSRGHFVQGIDPHWNETYRSHYRFHIPWIDVPELFRPGIVRTERTIDRHYNDANAFASTEYFNDWMAPQGFRHIMRSVLRSNDHDCISLFLFGDATRRGFEGRPFNSFKRLLPHLMRATEIQQRFETLDRAAGAATQSLNQLSAGIVHLDENGRILFSNRVAEELLEASDGIVSIGARIAPERTIDNAAFSTALRRVLGQAGPADDPNPPQASAVSLRRSSGQLPLSLTMVPASRQTAVFGRDQLAVVVLITDPATHTNTAADALVTLFGLTPSEARLTKALVEHGTLRQAAESAGITYQTARSYLKIVFQKTGAHRQSELVKLVAKSRT